MKTVQMTWMGHAEELRMCILRAFQPVLVLFFLSMLCSHFILQQVVKGFPVEVVALTPYQTFQSMFYITLALTLGLAFPFIIRGIYPFFRPVINDEHDLLFRKYIWGSYLLAVLGFLVGFYYVTPLCIQSLAGWDVVQSMWGLESIVRFTLMISLTVSLAFQIIILLPLLNRAGLINLEWFKHHRLRVLLSIILIIGLLPFTPSDPVGIGVCAVPFYTSFELGLIGCKIWR